MQLRHQHLGVTALLGLVWALALPACYAHRGARPAASASWVLEEAERACARQDEAAARHLLARFVREHPGRPRTPEVYSSLKQARPCQVFFEAPRTSPSRQPSSLP